MMKIVIDSTLNVAHYNKNLDVDIFLYLPFKKGLLLVYSILYIYVYCSVDFSYFFFL